MRLHDDEPWMEEGEVVALTDVVDRLASTARSHTGPFLIALDGRSASGKTTLAARLASVTPGTVVVHTDDIAWCHSRFGWDDLLIDGIIEPLRRGEMVDYRPPAWDARGREGSITVAAHASVVVIEGVGAGRATIAHAVDAVIWLQSDLDEAEARDRDRVAAGEIDQLGYEGWMAEEIPFQAEQRTWERAHAVVSGSPTVAYDPATELVLSRLTR